MVLNYNGGDMTLRCVEHLQKLETRADDLELTVTIVVVDNGSTDHVAATLQKPGSTVRVLRVEKNEGFPANNYAMGDRDDIDYVGLVNNDAFVEPGWLLPLVRELESEAKLGAVSSKMVFEPHFVEVNVSSPLFNPPGSDTRRLGVQLRGVVRDGVDVWSTVQGGEGAYGREPDGDVLFEWLAPQATVRVPFDNAQADGVIEFTLRGPSTIPVEVTVNGQTHSFIVTSADTYCSFPVSGKTVDVINNTGSIVFSDGAGADRGFLQRDDGQFETPQDVFAWCGGSVLFRPAYLDDVGLFDERFFLYYEDTDLSWRGQARGWTYRYVPTSVLRHKHAATSNAGSAFFSYYVERNRLLMILKNAPSPMVRKEVVRYVLTTASYFRRDVVSALVHRRRPNTTITRRRVKSFLGFLKLVPSMLRTRRSLRKRQLVSDDVLVGRMVQR